MSTGAVYEVKRERFDQTATSARSSVDRALVCGTKGRRFDPSRAHHLKYKKTA
jgi:hypothetical protein